MRLTVTIGDTVHDVEPGPGDMMELEEKYDVSLASLNVPKRDPDSGLIIRDANGDPETEPGPLFRLKYMYFLAWNVLHRTGVVTESFDEWQYLVGDVGSVPDVPLAPTDGS